MQIHKSTHKKKGRQYLWWVLAAAALVGLLYIVGPNSGSDDAGVLCDMESRSEDGNVFVSGEETFSYGVLQSDHKAFSGKYSVRLDDKNLYGPTYLFEHVYSGDVYEASIWMNNDNGFGALAFAGSWGFFADQKEVSKTEKGWHQLKLQVTIPVGVYDEKIQIFTLTDDNSKAIYFDDMYVRRVKRGNPATMPPVSDDPNKRLEITLDEKYLERLKEKRIEAYTRGSLISGKEDLVPAKLKTGDGSKDVQLRLKGDLLDHLRGRKWSFRIHMEDGNAWQGMKVFSVHNSKSRDHLSEWVFHQMLQDEDVLTTKYDYIEVVLNGESLGVYAYEEHFLKQLLQWQDRSEGPILKISEDAHWKYAPLSYGGNLAHYESAQIEPFDKGAMKKSNAYTAAFEKGQNLLHGFIHGELEVDEVFDVERMAKYLAIQDVCNAWHSFNYTNLRFYFNSQSGRLEPIGYDGFTDNGLYYNKALYITGSQVNELTDERITPHKFVKQFHKKIFTNLDFSARYNAHLNRMTSNAYLEAFKQKYEPDLRERKALISKAYVDYKFDWDLFFDNAVEVHSVMAPAPDLSIKAYRDGQEVVLRSYHLLPLDILGFGDTQLRSKIMEKIVLPSYDKTKRVLEQRIPLPNGSKNIFVRTLGTDRVVSFPIFKWTAPTMEAASTSRMKQSVKDFSFILDSPDAYIIPKGKHVLSKTLVVKDKQLIIQAGAEIDLQNRASIIATHSIQALGNIDAPIVIRSSNISGSGLVILNAEAESVFKSCTFDNLQSTKQFSLSTSGGVNVYESDAKFYRCVFSQSKAKDALHFDRSTYELHQCVITNASGDGLDASFSNGIVDELIVQDIAKDGIELSGGYCRVMRSKISNAAGAGVNASQHATVELMDISMEDGSEGVKSTDLSDVTVSLVHLKNIEIGMLAFRKQDEMGGGLIKIVELTEENVGKRNVHDQYSTILLERQKLPSQ